MFVVRCLLFVFIVWHCSLFVRCCCVLFLVCRVLFVVRCLLCVVCVLSFVVFVVCCFWFAVRRSLRGVGVFVVCCLLFVVV